MFKYLRYLCLLFVMLSAAHAANPIVIQLVTHDLPPYSFINKKGQADGLAMQRVSCALQLLKLPHKIRFVPWARAQMLARKGEADAFFAASQSFERDEYAVLSSVIAPQEWRWYWLKKTTLNPTAADFKSRAHVGSFLGGNMLEWLVKNNYQVTAKPVDNPQLLKMLLAGRVDAILANNLVMDSLVMQAGADNKVTSVLEQNKPLGVYFTKTFLAKNDTNFLPLFNQAMDICVTFSEKPLLSINKPRKK